MSNYHHLLFDLDDSGFLSITINRPDKMNALNSTVISEIDTAVDSALQNPNVKGIILTGAGDKAFVAGADIAEFAHFSKEEAVALARAGHEVFNKIENSNKPIIAAVNGFALGGGCELAMACHMRVASDNAKFGQPEVNLGVIPGYGGTQRLIQLIGKGKAFELLTTADMIDAEEAQRLGLANHITTLDTLIDTCKSILKKISRKGPLAVGKVVECVNAYFDKNKNGFETEIEAFAACFDTQDFKEGTQAFIEKRRAAFKGE